MASETRDDGNHVAGPSPPEQARLPSQATAGRRRPSNGDRINDIIETGRQRAESMDPDSLTLLRTKTHRTMDGERADETTGIMARGPGPSYQALSMGPAPRRRRKREDEEGDASGAVGGPPPPRWRGFVSKFQSLELENKGSVARDHLALERTFLAWLRTSLAFASIGVAVTQLFRLNTAVDTGGGPIDGGFGGSNRLRKMGRPLGTAFLAISIVTLLLGCKRYYHAQEWILKGKFPASRGTILVMALIALALMVLSLVVVVAIHTPN